MGIDLTYKKGGSYEAKTDLVIKDHKSYSVYLSDNSDYQEWSFKLDVQYWGDSHVDTKKASKRDAFFTNQVTQWREHAWRQRTQRRF